MTPEQKAKDLVNKFYYSLPNNGSIKEGINSCESRWKEAVMCALIAVDEIIHNNNEINGPGDGWMYVEESTDFWQQVKQEINKL
jgi:hypothetical protein